MAVVSQQTNNKVSYFTKSCCHSYLLHSAWAHQRCHPFYKSLIVNDWKIQHGKGKYNMVGRA